MNDSGAAPLSAGSHLGPHRPAAGDAHDLDLCRAARLRHVLRALRSPLFRLCRAEPGQIRRADGEDRRPLRNDRRRELHRRAVHRPLHRHDPLRLSRRPLRPTGDLHLVAPLVLGGQHHGGAADRRLRPQSVAARLRRRSRRRDRDHRRLLERTRAEGDARAGVRGQSGDRLLPACRSYRFSPSSSCRRPRSESRAGAGSC